MKKNQIVLLIVIALIALGMIWLAKRGDVKQNTPSENTVSGEIPSSPYEVVATSTANKGSCTPNEFTITQSQALRLEVTAVDNDYIFKVSDLPRLDTIIKKGETSTIMIEYVGPGEYPFTCGNGCSGKIIVEHKDDYEG
jgi:hypothetical protein